MKAKLRSSVFRGLATSWLERGDPSHPLLLLLHGFPDSSETWDAQADFFQSRFNVICPYARGAKPSEKAAKLSRYGTDAAALDLLQLIAEVDPGGKRKILCVGHDLGAVHAWHLAPLLGKRLAGLVLINGLGLRPMITRWNRLKQHWRSWYIYAMQLPGLAETMVRVAPHSLLNFAHSMGYLPPGKMLVAANVKDRALYPLNQYRQFVREIPKTLAHQPPRLQVPVLLLWGNRDAFLLPPTSEEWAPFAANLTTRILPGGHWVHREKTAEVNRVLDGFFASSLFGSAEGPPKESSP